MRRKFFSKFVSVTITALFFAGCTTSHLKKSIPEDQLPKYAKLVPLNNSAIDNIDGEHTGFTMLHTVFNVLPGKHTIATMTCNPTCAQPVTYNFEAKAGFAYLFNYDVKNRDDYIEVQNRFDPNIRVDTLMRTEQNIFITRAEFKEYQQKKLDKQIIAGELYAALRQVDFSPVRKIGARICQKEKIQGIVYVGFVEAITPEKVQIRISEAFFLGNHKLRPNGFSPSIIWDFPSKWELCE